MKKKQKKDFFYNIIGDLPSGCSHIFGISRENFQTLLKRYFNGKHQDKYRFYHDRSYDLSIHSSKYLAKSFWYSNIYLNIGLF